MELQTRIYVCYNTGQVTAEPSSVPEAEKGTGCPIHPNQDHRFRVFTDSVEVNGLDASKGLGEGLTARATSKIGQRLGLTLVAHYVTRQIPQE